MIQGKLSELSRYAAIPPQLVEIVNTFLTDHHGNPPCGRYEFAQDIYCNVEEVTGKEASASKLENHHRYIDLQITMGHEFVGLETAEFCRKVNQPYDEQRDIEFFDDLPVTYVEFTYGDFLWLLPGEAHAPCIGQGSWKKIVFKIPVE